MTEQAAARPAAMVTGDGRTMLLCGGFAMAPWVYQRTARLLGEHARVVVPDLFDVPGAWTYESALAGVMRLLDGDSDRVSVCAHSFGGALAVDLAVQCPERVADLVFSDTLAVTTRWRLAVEAGSGFPRLYRLASASAAASFVSSWLHHPRALTRAAWWAFNGSRDRDIDQVRASGIPATVLWASRDTLLDRRDGEAFARQLGGTFQVVGYPDGRATDHDWVFRDPELFAATLLDLRPWALAG